MPHPLIDEKALAGNPSLKRSGLCVSFSGMSEPLSSFGLPSDVLLWRALFLTFLSLAVGIVGGVVGLALGTVRLPFLLLFGMPPRLAAGTNILISALSAFTASYKHLREGRVDWYVVVIQGIPAIIGAFTGGFAAGLIPEALLILLAGTLISWQAVEMWLRASRDRAAVSEKSVHGPVERRWTVARIVAQGVAGFGIGFLGGAVGLILGTVRLPALISILNLDPRIAVGSNSVIGALMGGSGWTGHALRGQVDYPLLVLMGATAIAGSYHGAKLTGRISRRSLLHLLALVLAVVGALLIRDAYGRLYR